MATSSSETESSGNEKQGARCGQSSANTECPDRAPRDAGNQGRRFNVVVTEEPLDLRR
jgi:hypothetical protein